MTLSFAHLRTAACPGMWPLSEGPNGGDLVVGLAAIIEDPKVTARGEAVRLALASRYLAWAATEMSRSFPAAMLSPYPTVSHARSRAPRTRGMTRQKLSPSGGQCR